MEGVFCKFSQASRQKLQNLKVAMLDFRDSEGMYRFALRPSRDNEYNCLKWAKEMLLDASIVNNAAVNTWMPSWEVGNKDTDCLVM